MLQAAGKMEGHHRALQSAGGGANAQFGFCCGRWTHCRDPKAHVEFVESPGGVVETLCRRHAVKAKQAGGLFMICFSLGFLRVFFIPSNEEVDWLCLFPMKIWPLGFKDLFKYLKTFCLLGVFVVKSRTKTSVSSMFIT